MRNAHLASVAALAAAYWPGEPRWSQRRAPRRYGPQVNWDAIILAADGKSFRHRFTGQVRGVLYFPGRALFVQDGRSFTQSHRVAAHWLANADEVQP